MKRNLVPSSNFIRLLKRINKKHPELENTILKILEILSDNPFDSRLKTHKLKAKFEGCYSCVVGYDLRILIKFIDKFDNETKSKSEDILLLTIGKHDEVY